MLLQKTIELEDHLVPRRMGHDCIIVMVLIAGYDEEKILIVLSTTGGNFMLQVGSMKIRNICKGDLISDETFYPYTNFYTTGNIYIAQATNILSVFLSEYRINFFRVIKGHMIVVLFFP